MKVDQYLLLINCVYKFDCVYMRPPSLPSVRKMVPKKKNGYAGVTGYDM